MKEIVEKQRAFFQANQTKDISFRIRHLKKIKSILNANQQLLDEAIYLDFKKSSFENYTNELSLVYHDIDTAIKKIKRWARTKKVKSNLVNFPAKSYVVPEPLGVVLVIGAWNYPYQLSLAPLVAAIAAGNTVILKPSELPAHTSAIMAKLINENFDSNYLHVVEGGIPETSALLEQKFDKIFFTGSISIGKIIYQAAAKNLTPVTLELGGKSPAIITEDANLKMTVKRLIWSKYLNSGQTCISPDYILVQQSIKAEFLELAKAEIEKSSYSFENGNYVQIINDKNMTRLIDLIEKAKVYYGGTYDLKMRYIAPTILNNVTLDDKIMQDEIFGPLMPVLGFGDLSEAITIVNSMPQPLSCYVFTGNKETKRKVLNEIPFGGGGVNEAVMHITNNNMGFGGVGQSGIGAYHGEAGFKSFTHFKGILDKPNWLELNLKYHPYSLKKLKIIKFLMGQK